MTENVDLKNTSDTQRTGDVKKLFKIHGWSGAILGLLLYAVIVTGTAAVFHDEIGHWSSPLSQVPTDAFGPGLDAALKKAAESVDPIYQDEVSIFSVTSHRLSVFFHRHVHPEEGGAPFEEGVRFELDPNTWEVLDRREGSVEEISQFDNTGALARFLVELHVRLYLPNPWGLLLTGILGLAMMVAAVTGLVVHRHLIRDMFVQRSSRKNTLLTSRDRHVVAGSWNLVFTFLLAFTGSFFSFAGSFGLPVMAMVAFEGDQERLIEEVIGLPKAYDATSAGVADIDAMLIDASTRVNGEEVHPEFVGITRWGQVDAVASVILSAGKGDLKSTSLLYNAATGEFIRSKPGIGLQPSLGDDLLSLINPLHFGNFAGVFSKAVWFGLGFAASYVVLSGMLLWTKRRENQPSWRWLHRSTLWMGFGLLVSLGATPIGFFSADWFGIERFSAVKQAFVVGAVVSSLMCIAIRDFDRLSKSLLGLFGALLIFAVFLRWLSGGMGWATAASAGWSEVPALDILFLFCGGLLMYRLYSKPVVPSLTPANQNN